MAKSFLRSVKQYLTSITRSENAPFLNFSRAMVVRAYSSNDQASLAERCYVSPPPEGGPGFVQNSTEISRSYKALGASPLNILALPYFVVTYMRNGLFQGINAIDHQFGYHEKSSWAATGVKALLGVIFSPAEFSTWAIARASNHAINGVRSAISKSPTSGYHEVDEEPESISERRNSECEMTIVAHERSHSKSVEAPPIKKGEHSTKRADTEQGKKRRATDADLFFSHMKHSHTTETRNVHSHSLG
ncbi:hypothetical protein [Piscirickettsia litoralis]|uniref:Uncharacterized protein n=1 Tax=Piscirickettsia litoralis TaxID=1891921 RepID=A0ABX3A0M8_9GAMM|nr:hypothetical protein [Piscirickettsia litoralis]ODN42421.1 hypothetical protein BGC07_05085 [Piscirickettsia litoralis]